MPISSSIPTANHRDQHVSSMKINADKDSNEDRRTAGRTSRLAPSPINLLFTPSALLNSSHEPSDLSTTERRNITDEKPVASLIEFEITVRSRSKSVDSRGVFEEN
ncbi:hypothetical protein L1887_23470 [Cichorium endivia]|nr:hypothetical protein L1887_23470 [Cichorium endivia]